MHLNCVVYNSINVFICRRRQDNDFVFHVNIVTNDVTSSPSIECVPAPVV